MKTIAIAVTLLATTAVACTAQDRLTMPAGANGLVRIVAADGDVRVRGGTGTEVRVIDLDGGETRGLRVRQRDGGVDIDVYDSRDIEVMVPAGSRIDARSRSGDVDIEAVRGTIFAETLSGDIVVTGTPSSVTVESISGDIEIEGRVGTLRLVTVSGDVSVPHAIGSIDIATTSGDLDIVSEGVTNGDLSSTSGDVHFSGEIRPDAVLDFSTASGAVELTVARTVSGDFDLENVTGRIRSDLGPEPRRHRYTGGESLQFTNGRGEARIVARSVSGEIYVVVR